MKNKLLYILITIIFFPRIIDGQMIHSTVDSTKNKEASLQDPSRIGRTSGAKSPAFQELYDYENEENSLVNAMFPYQCILHRAYVIMLASQKIINLKEAKAILNGLDKVDSIAKDNSSLHVYMPYEAKLIEIIGPIGGKMHIGRSRNDLDNTTNRMYLRDQLLATIHSIIQLRSTLLQKASENLETVMVVYTHRKEAQPITLGHYYTAIDEAISKSLSRYIELYARINQSPLGSGATGGTSWPLDRNMVADLLGFNGLVYNTIEGVAGWDHIAEFAADNAIFMSELSRLASEIQLWSTDEYKMAELDNAYAGISSMMPQKKNPDALERSRKASNLTVGQLMSILTSLNAIEYQHSGTRYPLDPKSINAVLAATHAMTGVVETLHPNKEVMLKYAKENFSTMTDLADVLVRECNLDFREAHEVISLVVNEALAQQLTSDKITIKMIENASLKYLHRKISISENQLQSAIDPTKSVLRKTGIGMPAPSSVQKMIDSATISLEQSRQWLQHKQDYLDQKTIELNKAVIKFKN